MTSIKNVSQTIWETVSAEASQALGERIGRACQGGEVLALIGQLGTGKTCLIKGVAAGLGVPSDSVASPTFALIHEYAGRLPVCHADLYRLEPQDALNGLGLEEYLRPPWVTLIEWADRAPSVLPKEHLRIMMEHLGGDRRRITVTSAGAQYDALLVKMQGP